MAVGGGLTERVRQSCQNCQTDRSEQRELRQQKDEEEEEEEEEDREKEAELAYPVQWKLKQSSTPSMYSVQN